MNPQLYNSLLAQKTGIERFSDERSQNLRNFDNTNMNLQNNAQMASSVLGPEVAAGSVVGLKMAKKVKGAISGVREAIKGGKAVVQTATDTAKGISSAVQGIRESVKGPSGGGGGGGDEDGGGGGDDDEGEQGPRGDTSDAPRTSLVKDKPAVDDDPPDFFPEAKQGTGGPPRHTMEKEDPDAPDMREGDKLDPGAIEKGGAGAEEETGEKIGAKVGGGVLRSVVGEGAATAAEGVLAWLGPIGDLIAGAVAIGSAVSGAEEKKKATEKATAFAQAGPKTMSLAFDNAPVIDSTQFHSQ